MESTEAALPAPRGQIPKAVAEEHSFSLRRGSGILQALARPSARGQLAGLAGHFGPGRLPVCRGLLLLPAPASAVLLMLAQPASCWLVFQCTTRPGRSGQPGPFSVRPH